MKQIFLFFIFAMSFNLGAQTDSSQQTEYYLQFKAVPRSFSSGKYNIYISFGQEYLSKDSIERVFKVDKVQSFKEINDALQYMNALGWKLITAFATSHEHNPTFYYVMKWEAK